MSKNFELLQQVNKSPTVQVPSARIDSLEMSERASRHLRPASMDPRPDWMHALKVLQKHWRLSASFALVVFVTVTTLTLLMKPVYEPVARIEIDPPGAETFSMESGGSGDESQYLETSAKNLQSDQLAIAVIRALRLQSNQAISTGIAEIERKIADHRDDYHLTPEENVALRNFQSQLKVKRDTGSRLINVSFASHDPQVAANVVNTLLKLYIEKSYKTRLEAIRQSTEWLSRQLDDVRKKMQDSNRALSEFQSKSGIADIDDNKNTFSEQLGELNRQRTQAQTERIRLGSVLNGVRGESPDALPEVHSSPVVQHLTQKLAEIQAEHSQSLVIYGPNHPNAKKLQKHADELESQLDHQRKSILGELRNSYAATHERERVINSEMKKTTEELNQMGQYSALKKEAQASAELYNALYRRIKEAGISAGSKSNGIRIIDGARVLDKPTRPNRVSNIALGLLAGLMGGGVLAFVMNGLDNRIHTPEDIMQLGASSSISIIPVIGSGKGAGYPEPARLFAGKKPVPEKFLLERPRSPEAEALRGLHTSLMLSRLGRAPQLVLVTSSFPGEGKTTLAVNLALALAQTGPTCFVEADMRKTGVCGAFGLRSDCGLTDVLAGSVTLEQALLEVPELPNLTFLPSGPISSRPELVCSELMHGVMSSLRQSFTFVVVDSPPILPYADGRALSTFVDGVVFVGRCGVSTREAIQRSMTLLAEIHSAPVLEIVLNAARFVSPEYRYKG
jgi:succinoglycan biosynthesis transport protein ExoP